jgi:hypothetical protein
MSYLLVSYDIFLVSEQATLVFLISSMNDRRCDSISVGDDSVVFCRREFVF